ncbi:MAG: hypothetical protein AAF772_05300 [Acidobacteriota bacterium]
MVVLPLVVLDAGLGGLASGVVDGLRPLDLRIALYVEAEALLAGLVAARIEAGALPAAPLWADRQRLPDAGRAALRAVAARYPLALCARLPTGRHREGYDRDGRPLGWTATAAILRDLRPELVVLAGGARATRGLLANVCARLAANGLHAAWDVLCPSEFEAHCEAPTRFIVGASDRVLDLVAFLGGALAGFQGCRRSVDDADVGAQASRPARGGDPHDGPYPPAPDDLDAWQVLARRGLTPAIGVRDADQHPFPGLAERLEGIGRDDWAWILRQGIAPKLAARAVAQLLHTLVEGRRSATHVPPRRGDRHDRRPARRVDAGGAQLDHQGA